MIPSQNGNYFTGGMLRNYVKSAWRSLKRQKLPSSINLLGLVVSIASCVLIMVYVQYELSYDNYHQRADRIFRLTTQLTVDGKEDHTAWAPNFISQQLKADYPEIEEIIRLQANPGNISFNVVAPSTRQVPRVISLDQVYTVYDPAFLTVFSYPLLAGDPPTALVRPGSVVVTERVARKLFGPDWNLGKGILGQWLQSGENTYQITGVLRDIPFNTDMPFQVLLAQEAGKLEKQAWCTSYVVFKQAANGIGFSPKLAQVAQAIQADFAKRGGHIAFSLENLKDIHLGEPKLFDTPKANRSYLLIFSLVAGFLLLIASINYINLSLAQSVGRSREVGVRKAVGAARYQVLFQFLGESLLVTGIALVLSLALVILLLPVYNQLADTHFSLSSLLTWPMAALLSAIFVIVGVLAGSYPAFYLSSFEPVKALKGKLRLVGNSASVHMGQGLVVLQFTISITIIIGTLVVYKQLHYLQHKPLGFQREQVLVVAVPREAAANGALSTLQKALSGLASVWGVALIGSHSLPSQDMNLSAFNLAKGGKMLPLPQRSIDVDEHYLTVLAIPLMAGRNFAHASLLGEKTGPVVHEVLVNEALVAKMGWRTELAIGEEISQGPLGAETWRGRVVGVIKNFHFQSPQKPIEPMVLQNTAWQGPEKLLVRLSTGELARQLDLIETQWKRIVPDQAFEVTFLEATFAQQYRQEQRLVTIFTYFSLLTIVVSCLGLFGLSSLATAQRTKEVGIRKVMGAQAHSLIYLLSRQFLLLVGLAVLLASPLAWFAMKHWLQDFAYHVSIGPGEFVMAGGAAFLIAALTTGYHAIRLVRTNAVRALRYE
ncbi:ABC transporter permease [Spirosoma endophyticum]|uniref:Putative ABC transport system permease protein n=1 Tax=Spirosoma endophyticum TaxID=662367 RepID=A0A1I2ETW4_9BACT|nr:ABC transporter permease [Spirosoma endophyticum]SFE96143.1 putative ABC transport system permease protein [Spirosoma endophyticum]